MSGQVEISADCCANLTRLPLKVTHGGAASSPLPGGERSPALCGRVSDRSYREILPPHPNPLPNGERERAEFPASPWINSTATRLPQQAPEPELWGRAG